MSAPRSDALVFFGAFGMNAVAPSSETDSRLVELAFQSELGGGDMDAHEGVTPPGGWQNPAMRC